MRLTSHTMRLMIVIVAIVRFPTCCRLRPLLERCELHTKKDRESASSPPHKYSHATIVSPHTFPLSRTYPHSFTHSHTLSSETLPRTQSHFHKPSHIHAFSLTAFPSHIFYLSYLLSSFLSDPPFYNFSLHPSYTVSLPQSKQIRNIAMRLRPFLV